MINIREIDHVVLRVEDIEAMSRFYCVVLGAKLKGPSDGSAMPPPGAGRSE